MTETNEPMSLISYEAPNVAQIVNPDQIELGVAADVPVAVCSTTQSASVTVAEERQAATPFLEPLVDPVTMTGADEDVPSSGSSPIESITSGFMPTGVLDGDDSDSFWNAPASAQPFVYGDFIELDSALDAAFTLDIERAVVPPTVLMEYRALLDEPREIKAASFFSVKESVREFRGGKCVEHHLEAMNSHQQRELLRALAIAVKESKPAKGRSSGGSRAAIAAPVAYTTSAEFRFVRYVGYSRVPKPTRYSHPLFVRWVQGESSELYRTNRGWIATVNDAAAVLLGNPRCRTKDLPGLLQAAAVVAVPWSSVKTNSRCDVIRRTLVVRSMVFAEERDFEPFETRFSKHKPLRRAVARYFSGDVSIDGQGVAEKLEALIFPRESATADRQLLQLHQAGTAGVEFTASPEFLSRERPFVSESGSVLQGAELSKSAAGTSEPSLARAVGREFATGVVDTLETDRTSELARALSASFMSGALEDKSTQAAGLKVVRSLLNFVLGMAQLINAHNATGVLLAVSQTLVGDPYAMDLLSERFSPVLQGSGEEVVPENTWWSRIVGLGFFSMLREFVGEVYGALVPSFLELCGAIKFATLKEFSSSIASYISGALLELYHRAQACYKTGTFAPLWGTEPSRWARHSAGIVRYHEYITSKTDGKLFADLARRDEIPPRMRLHMTHAEFVELLDEHIAMGDNLVGLGAHGVQASCRGMLASLRAIRAEVEFHINGSHKRVNPFCVLLYGPPGTGKTTDCEHIANMVAALEGRGPADIYYHKNENFRTLLRAHTTVIRMDDPDAGVAPPSATFEDHCQFFQSIASTQPYPIEQAGVEEKGKHFARPTDIIGSTNFKDVSARMYAREPSAIWRRWNLYVRVSVKPAHALPDGRLDTVRCRDPNPRLYAVEEFVDGGQSGQDLCTRVLEENLEWEEFIHFLLTRRDEWLSQQRLMLRDSTTVCDSCALPSSRCVCQYAELQGATTSAPREELEEEDSVADELAAAAKKSFNERFWECYRHYGPWAAAIAPTAILSVAAIATLFSIYSITSVALEGRDAGTANDSWHRASGVREPSVPKSPPVTWTKADIIRAVRASLARVQGDRITNGVLYRSGWVLFPTHAVGAKDPFKITHNGRTVILRHAEMKLLSNAEYAVAYIAGDTALNGVATYWAPFPMKAQRLGDCSLIGEREYHLGEARASMENGLPTWAYEPATQAGDCGSCLIGEGPGGGYRIFGAHLWGPGEKGPPRASSAELSASQIDAAIDRNCTYKQMFQGGAPPTEELVEYPAKSEIAVAFTFYNCNALQLGTIRTRGRTLKTAHKPTSFQEQVRKFADKLGINHKYAIPEFRGGMVDGTYFSPWIHALRDSNTCRTEYLEEAREYAAQVLALGRFSGPLTEAEAIGGIPGEINSVNVRTSMGPPFGGPKTAHIDKVELEISPELAAQLDEIEAILAVDRVPIFYCEATLKDEVLKEGKNARVFCQMAAAGNIMLKRYSVVLKRAFRASMIGTHCAVGIDMGSRACEDIVEWLLDCPYYYDLDGVKVDKNWTPEVWDATILFAKIVTEECAGAAVARKFELLLMGLKDAVISIKGDLAVLNWNPSGNDLTVELNVIMLTLMFRKVFKELGLLQFLWWILYGDDSILRSKVRLPDNFFSEFRRITGMELTNGAKTLTLAPEPVPIEQLVFLKRNFRYDREYRTWTAPLQETSIVKMLMFRGKSTLSPLDHEVELVEAAGRYAVLLGRERYAVWKDFLREVCPLASLQDYDIAMEAYVLGKYTDWMDRNLVHDGAPTPENGRAEAPDASLRPVLQGKQPINMSFHSSDAHNDAPLINAAPEEPLPVGMTGPPGTALQTVQASTDLEEDSVQIVGPPALIRDTAKSSFSVFQEPPAFALSAFPQRPTRIRVTQLSSANNPLNWGASAVVDSFPLYATLMANPAMADKHRNWTYWRGTVKLIGVLSVPGNASGEYVVSVVPGLSTTYPPQDSAFGDEACLAYEHCVRIPVSTSADFEMSIPFWNTNDVSSFDPLCDWNVYVTCLSPLRTSIPGGVSTGSLTLYALLEDDYRYMLPKWQGKLVDRVKEARSTKVVSRTARTVEKAASILSGVPVIGAAAAMVANAASTVGTVAEFFGFSRENQEPVVTSFATRSVSNVASVDAVDSGNVAGFSTRNQISIAPDISGSPAEDTMSFESMGSRWVAVANFTWAAGTAANAVLKTVPVHPGYGYGGTTSLRPTAAGYCLLPFQYWRADAEYMVVIPASNLHRGALQVLYVPSTSQPAAGDNVTNVGLNAIMDISSETSFKFEVGYAREAPMLPMEYWNDAHAISRIGLGNGVLQFRVVNPLVSQNPTDSINVVVFVRFRNIQAAVPRTHLTWINSTNTGLISYPWESGVLLQGKAAGDDDLSDEVQTVALVPGSGYYPTDAIVAGERIMSLRATAQRPSKLGTSIARINVIAYGGRCSDPINVGANTTAAHAILPFVTAASSERLKVFPQGDTWVGAWAATNLNTLSSLAAQTLDVPAQMPITYTGPQKGAEFSIPYYSPLRAQASRITAGATVNNAFAEATRRVLVYRCESGASIAYYSLGDDIRVGPFRRIPFFSFSTSVPPTRGWFT